MPQCAKVEDKNTLFPVFFKLERLHTIIVGGGAVGLEKLTTILSNAPEANVILVGESILPEIKELSKLHPSVILKEKLFSPCDLYGKDLAIIATNDHEENICIHHQAKAMRILVNVADTPLFCDFYLGSIVQKGSLKIAISTNGKSPTVAKRIRETLTALLPDEMEGILSNLGEIRKKLTGNFSEKVRRLNEITSVLVEEEK